MADKIGFNFLWAVLGGIFGFVLAVLLDSTEIFPIANLPEIGLFLGVLFGGFKDKLSL